MAAKALESNTSPLQPRHDKRDHDHHGDDHRTDDVRAWTIAPHLMPRPFPGRQVLALHSDTKIRAIAHAIITSDAAMMIALAAGRI